MVNTSDKLNPIKTGLLEFAVLTVIAREESYVADILKRLSETELSTQEGTLYPLLSRLRREGLLEYEWRESEAGPPRKYYRLTAEGRRMLKELEGYWENINKTIKSLRK